MSLTLVKCVHYMLRTETSPVILSFVSHVLSVLTMHTCIHTYVCMYILNLHFFLINFSTVGEDYIGEVYNVTFDGSNIATVPVPSVDDDLVEGVEEFTAVIRVPNDTQREHLVTRGSPDTATVEINDNDSE